MDLCYHLYHHYHPILSPLGTEPQTNHHFPFPKRLVVFAAACVVYDMRALSMVRKGRGGPGGGRYRWVVCGEQRSATQNSDSLALLCGPWGVLLISSHSTDPPLPQPPPASLRSSVGRQKQLCVLAASAVPTAVLHCSIPAVIKYLGGCCRPLYHGQKCHVLRFGFHWVLVRVSRKL